MIGIASHERIWKLCFEVNRLLDLNLRERESEPPPPEPEPPQASLLPPLKRPHESAPLEAYEDAETLPQVECLLCTANRRSLPPAARPFPFFLVLHFRENATLPWETSEILARLQTSEAVISAVDLSHIKHIKQVLP